MPRISLGSAARFRGVCFFLCFSGLSLSACQAENPPEPPAAQNTKRGDEPASKTPASQNAKPAAKPAPRFTNRLAKETSPYLLMHAHNPVDWRPWGAEALAKARKEKKMIFLSVGYSSCYWCHVMERESFLDEEIAAFLNEHFVCIKVDREERPDIDEIYMTSLQVYLRLTRSGRGGGWPLSMFLTPEAKPLGGGTYFPPRAKNGLDGFLDVAKRVQGVWTENPERVMKGGEQIASIVKEQLARRGGLPVAPDAKLAATLKAELADQYDELHGGFGFSETNPRQPKFPEPSNILFLLDRARRHRDKAALAMAVGTLEKMDAGGIRDHLGGGFHRYSTDRYWRAPHFEKMLYDNGQLATAYAEAFEITQQPRFRRVTEGILRFVLRELTHKDGGFYSALDAETDEEEGLYYLWKTEELTALLSPEEFKLFADVYGVKTGPNFEGKHILLLPSSLADFAKGRKMSEQELVEKLIPIRDKLLAARGKRPRPLLDTKVLAGWNGLMIRGFADAGRIFKEDHYTAAAARAADFVLKKLRTPEGRLLRTYTAGEAKYNGYLDDYAFLANGLIALHRATGEQRWLDAADQLTATQIKLFWDDRGGGFFFTSSDHEALIARSKGPVDSARPSGNSVSAENLIYLSQALNRPEYLKRAEQTIRAVAAILNRAPTAFPRMTIAVEELRRIQTKKQDAPANK